jgi:Cyclophilin type peptidyl-prolyl cis-trans isomerase/CLD
MQKILFFKNSDSDPVWDLELSSPSVFHLPAPGRDPKTILLLICDLSTFMILGNLNLELYCDTVPKTCENFIKLAQKGYYNGTVFHR